MILTDKQRRFLAFIQSHVREHHRFPSYRELMRHFGFRSPHSVTQNLQALEKKGLLVDTGEGHALADEPTTYGAAIYELRRLRAALALEQGGAQ